MGVHGVGPAAFLGSVIASCDEDPVLAANIAGLGRFAAPAIRLLQRRLAPLGNERVNRVLHLPLDNPVDFLNPARYVEQDSDSKRAPKMQQVWAKEVHVAAARKLAPLEKALGDCDFVASQARARPVGPILNLRLSNIFNRFTPAQFIAWFRWQFRIPQLARLGNSDAEGVELCIGNCRSRALDLHGNHANSGLCAATLAGRGGKHQRLKNVVSFHGAKAGCIVSWVKEETTVELLMHQFSLEQCQAMFPRRPKVKLAEAARELEREQRRAAWLAPAEREAKRCELATRLQTLLDSVENGQGLRLDGTITHPPSGQQVWYDVTAVHTTCTTYLSKELALTRRRQAAGKEGEKLQSAGLLDAHQLKLDRYSLLATLVEQQVLDKLRSQAPAILPVAVSTHGEFCPGAVRLQEWLCEKFRARLLLEGDRDDGQKLVDLVSGFRHEFRSSLLVASAKGTADMLNAAGLPFKKRGVQTTHGTEGKAQAGRRRADPSPGPTSDSELDESELDDDDSEGVANHDECDGDDSELSWLVTSLG